MEKKPKQKKWLWGNFNKYEIMVLTLPILVCFLCFIAQFLYGKDSSLTTLGKMLLIVVGILTLCAVLFLIFVPAKLNVENYDANLLAKWRSEKDEMLFLGAAVGSFLLSIFQALDYEWLHKAFPKLNPENGVIIVIGSVLIAFYLLLLLGIRYRCLSEGIILQENEAKKIATQYHVQIERANN